MACKKKLHALNPEAAPPVEVQSQRTRRRRRRESGSPLDIEREVRQLLADKVSGNMVGIWLLVPELLRLGAWDVLKGWSGATEDGQVAPRLALHLVNEAALGHLHRQRIGFSQKGFELANGLPFVPSDQTVHDLLAAHSMQDAMAMQRTLGLLRRASGHYQGRRLAIDPHHMRSYTKRQTRRHKHHPKEKAIKTSQTLFMLDVDTLQPLCSGLASASCPVGQTVPELLRQSAAILGPTGERPLVLADREHFTRSLFAEAGRLGFDLLVPAPERSGYQRRMAAIDESDYTRHWPGYATARTPFQFAQDTETYTLLVQREGERPADYLYRGFLCNSPRPELESLTEDFPARWHIEEFFNRDQAIGWKRAGTLNLNIRYNHQSLAQIAQAAVDQFRRRLPAAHSHSSARSLATQYFNGLDGDLRVEDDTIVVTYYNAPRDATWRAPYETLSATLAAEGISPTIPWLYSYKLAYRFR